MDHRLLCGRTREPASKFQTNASGSALLLRSQPPSDVDSSSIKRRQPSRPSPKARSKGSTQQPPCRPFVNANTRVGISHTTRAQRSMLAAKESARGQRTTTPLPTREAKPAPERGERNAQLFDRDGGARRRRRLRSRRGGGRGRGAEEAVRGALQEGAEARGAQKEVPEDDLERARKTTAS